MPSTRTLAAAAAIAAVLCAVMAGCSGASLASEDALRELFEKVGVAFGAATQSQ